VNRRRLLPHWSIILLLLPVVTGCSYRLQIELFDNTNESIAVELGRDSLVVESGRSVRFDYPGDARSWMIQLRVANCIYAYRAPRSLEHYHSLRTDFKEPLKAQLEGDLGIFLLPPSAAGVQSVASLGDIQQDGFPLHPVMRSCR